MLALPSLARAQSQSLIKNGDFQAGAEKPDAWPAPKGETITYPTDGENRFMRLKVGEPGKMISVYRQADAKPGEAFVLTFKARYDDVKVGEKNYFDARVFCSFRDAEKKEIKPNPKPISWRGTNSQWTEYKLEMTAPEGSTVLAVMFTLFNAQNGTLDIDDVKLERGGAATRKAE